MWHRTTERHVRPVAHQSASLRLLRAGRERRREPSGLGGQAVFGLQRPAHSTRIHQFSLDMQRELGRRVSSWRGYSGSVTHNLIQGTPSININQLPDADLALGNQLNTKVANPFYGTTQRRRSESRAPRCRSQLLLPYPQFGAILADAARIRITPAITRSTSKLQKRLGTGSERADHLYMVAQSGRLQRGEQYVQRQPSTSQDNYNRAAEWSLATINTPALDDGGELRTAVRQRAPVPFIEPVARLRGGRMGGEFPDHDAVGVPAGDFAEQPEFGDRDERAAAECDRDFADDERIDREPADGLH